MTLHPRSDQRRSWPKHRPGDYCHFVLYKEDRDTMDAINQLAHHLHLRPNMFTYCGVKDRRAKTSQLVSIRRVEASRLAALNRRLRGIVLGNFAYQKQPLALGQLYGNRFQIVLRFFLAVLKYVYISVLLLLFLSVILMFLRSTCASIWRRYSGADSSITSACRDSEPVLSRRLKSARQFFAPTTKRPSG